MRQPPSAAHIWEPGITCPWDMDTAMCGTRCSHNTLCWEHLPSYPIESTAQGPEGNLSGLSMPACPHPPGGLRPEGILAAGDDENILTYHPLPPLEILCFTVEDIMAVETLYR